MLITISGTPGTGKTAVAKLLAKKINAKLITTDFLVNKYKIPATLDRKRKTKIIDTRKLSFAARKESIGKTIFEGHLSHFTRSDIAIILRTSPQELEKRLKKKKWSAAKIRENIEAEVVGIISSEAVNAKKVFEIDTTGKSAEKTALLLLKILNNHSMQKRYVIKIDWSQDYVAYLKKKK